MDSFLVIVGVAWIVCGVYVYGVSFAFFQREYPSLAQSSYWDSFVLSALGGVAGPIALLGAVIVCRGGFRHGFKFW